MATYYVSQQQNKPSGTTSVTGTVVTAGTGTQTIRFEFSAAVTAAMPLGEYAISAVLSNTHKVPLASVKVELQE